MQMRSHGFFAAALILAVGVGWGCRHNDVDPQSDLNTLKMQRERKEVEDLSQKYPEAHIAQNDSLVDALRAALRASEAQNARATSGLPKKPGPQTTHVLGGG